MPPQPVQARRRNRKRKRRQASSSSESSSSASSSSDDESQKHQVTKGVTKDETKLKSMGPPTVEDEETSSPSASDSSSSVSDSESSSGNDEKEEAMDVDAKDGKGPSKGKQRSRSPSPANMDLPRGLPLEPKTDEEKRTDAQFRERFRKFWMASMAKSFGDELAELQKEPNMTKPKLSMLIDALAAGTNIYLPTTNDGSTTRIDEAEILLGLKK